jgi:hypothetical protein
VTEQTEIKGTTVDGIIKQQVASHKREALKKIEESLKTKVKVVIDAQKVLDTAKGDL